MSFKGIFTGEEIRKCDEHGEYTSRELNKRWSPCPKCVDKEIEKETTQRLDEIAAQDAVKNKVDWETKLGCACIPVRFRDRTFESYKVETPEQKYAHDFAKQYAESFQKIKKTGTSAIFYGEPGTGKTHLSCAIAKHIMDKFDATVLFITALRAIRRIKSTWHHLSKETENDAVDALTYPDLLIIDEIGVQFGSDTEQMYLFDILNQRYENNKPTIILSNCDKDEIKRYLGDRVFDRMKEDGGSVIAFSWESHRGKIV